MRLAALPCAAIAVALVACNTSGLPASRPSPTSAVPSAGTAPPAPTPEPFTDRSLADALIASGLPVANVRVLNAENDPNALLGKPDQYVGKIFWTDTRAQVGQPTAELFADDASMQARFAYLDGIFRAQPLGFQYMYRNDAKRILLRVPQSLTPAQAGEYEDWLKKV